MENTVLILGPTGRLGRNAAAAFDAAGWEVRRFDRAKDNLWDAAWGASVIVNGWHPPYPRWAAEVPGLTQQIIEVAQASGATVIIPGNVYVYGAQAPERFAPNTPHLATNPLGRVRIEMEAAFKASGVQTFIVRSGDFLDTEASGNWFDMVMAKPVAKGTLTYPGPLDIPHAFSFLPDVAATMVSLTNQRKTLGRFEDLNAPSLTLTGTDLAAAVSDVVGRPVKAKRMAWWPIRAASLAWPLGRALIEMRYLWTKPHSLDQSRLTELCPDVTPTPLASVLRHALNHHIDPDEMVRPSGQTIPAE